MFHEVDFDNPAGVHSHWKQVEVLQRAIPGQVLGYHTPFLDNAPLALVQEGHRYYLDWVDSQLGIISIETSILKTTNKYVALWLDVFGYDN